MNEGYKLITDLCVKWKYRFDFYEMEMIKCGSKKKNLPKKLVFPRLRFLFGRKIKMENKKRKSEKNKNKNKNIFFHGWKFSKNVFKKYMALPKLAPFKRNQVN